MDILPPSIQNLMSYFEHLPGIGPKSAARIVLFLLKNQPGFLSQFGKSIITLKDDLAICSVCSSICSHDPCDICSNPRRDKRIICVVEDILDILAFEQGADFNGVYHVLGGVISPLKGMGPEDLTINKLIERVKKDNIDEILLATNPNIEGEATAMFIKDELIALKLSYTLKITRLARGLPTGADLEYADKITLKRAIENRTEF